MLGGLGVCFPSHLFTSVYHTYIQECFPNSDRELRCVFLKIPPNLLDGIRNGTLNFTYSLVAAGVPGLDNLHLMSQFVFEFVDDPVVTPFNGTMSYQGGSNAVIKIDVSMHMYMFMV